MENDKYSRTSIPAAPDTAYIPRLVEGPDTSRFSFDPLTMELMKLIDGKKPAAQIAHTLGANRQEILDRLSALETAQLVQITAEMMDHANSYHPAAPPPVEEPDIEDTQPVHAIAHNHAIASAVHPLDAVSPGPLPEGNLIPGKGREVIQGAISEKFSGSLTFSTHDHEVIVHFVEGDPEGVQSTFDSHEHGLLLFSHKKISRNTYETYKDALVNNRARHPVDALRAAGISDRKELGKLIYQRGRIILEELETWEDGTYFKKHNTIFPTTIARCSLMPPAGDYKSRASETRQPTKKERVAWRETHLTEEQEAYLKERVPRYMKANQEMGQQLASLSLTNREKEYLKNLLEKPMQVSFAMAISPLPKTVTRRLILQLLSLGIFDLSETNPDGISEVLPDDLHNHLATIKSQHPFDIIAAHATSTKAEIEHRYKKTIAIFDDKFYAGITPEQRADLVEIRRRINDAYGKLRDDRERRRIREALWDTVQLGNFYEIQVKKAKIALQMRRDADAAMLLASSALEIRPNGAEAFGLLNGAKQLKRETRER